MKAELDKLVALQKSDTEIKKLKKAIETVEQRRAAIEQEFEARAFEIRALEKKRATANAEKLHLDNELAEANLKLERAENNLKQSQNQKQYEAAMREKGVFQKQISDLETESLEKGETIEETDKILSARADEIANLEAERAASLKNFEKQTEGEKAQLASQQQKREKAFATLPKNLAATYDRLVQRIRDGVAVAEVKNGACGSCSMKLRPQMVVDIKVGKQILTCENCNRILYIAPAAEAQTV
ncbi:MAG: C4-type zinc ribbon domain-containing protein [Pyrinomonadaceae bacterium]